MADLPRRRRDGALGVVGAVTLGAMSATFVAPPVLADEPEYPSWADVHRAKTDQGAAEQEADRIAGQIGDLQDRADAAGRIAAIAVERFHRARLAEDDARARRTELAAQADRAQTTARTSRMRAGLLAASITRRVSGEPRLLLDSGEADDFFGRIATVSQLSAQTRAIMRRALQDERQASAVGAQADAAAVVLTQRAEAAQEALGAAQRAVSTATEAVTTEQRHADRLVAQLAALRGTSTRVAAQYAAGVRAELAQTATSTGGVGSPSTAGPVEPAPAGSSQTMAGPPNSAQAASAVAFARDQIGDAYRFGGAGPNSWDCSGLTMQAYASVGIGIGGHSATAQYRLAKARGQLLPYSQAQVGDLVFAGDGGGEPYYVAIYSGVGTVIEAPYPGVPVREVPVRSADRIDQVARPTAAV